MVKHLKEMDTKTKQQNNNRNRCGMHDSNPRRQDQGIKGLPELLSETFLDTQTKHFKYG